MGSEKEKPFANNVVSHEKFKEYQGRKEERGRLGGQEETSKNVPEILIPATQSEVLKQSLSAVQDYHEALKKIIQEQSKEIPLDEQTIRNDTRVHELAKKYLEEGEILQKKLAKGEKIEPKTFADFVELGRIVLNEVKKQYNKRDPIESEEELKVHKVGSTDAAMDVEKRHLTRTIKDHLETLDKVREGLERQRDTAQKAVQAGEDPGKANSIQDRITRIGEFIEETKALIQTSEEGNLKKEEARELINKSSDFMTEVLGEQIHGK